MKRIFIFFSLFLSFVLVYFLVGSEKGPGRQKVAPVPDSILFTQSPVLTPEQALQTFDLHDDYSIELVASEPLVQDPVVLDFDARGRIWVVEMRGYMPDAFGTGEDEKSGRIVILEDDDADGTMDRYKVFKDSLIMPRSIAVVNDGILYAEPPNLWFVENINDKPGKKILVDSAYAVGGNVEHQPNGLMRGIDNWYYNAKSKTRYRYQNKQWIKQETEFRGQWGITKDDYGRLFYNTNSNQLRADLVPPNTLHFNSSNFSARSGINVQVADDQEVFPIRPTPGVNRGYREHILDDSLRLANFTAACGPLIYRGGHTELAGSAFVCEPAGNLVKRNILTENGVHIEANQAYEGFEFLASKDERFRPVNLYNAPDGSIYLVDMYRGIIQHEIFLTDYLREQIISRDLEKPIGLGRIYRITPKKSWLVQMKERFFPQEVALHTASNKELISLLSHENGWFRDNAQRLLIQRDDKAVVPELIEVLKDEDTSGLAKIHALWTLEGMNIHSSDVIALGIASGDPKVIATAVRIGAKNSTTEGAKKTLELYQTAAHNEDAVVQLQLALSLGAFWEVNAPQVLGMLKTISLKQGDDPLMQQAIVSSTNGRENELLKSLPERAAGSAMMVSLKKVIERQQLKKELKAKALSPTEKEQYITGKQFYAKTCAACHNENGQGLVPVAPPLADSEWVNGHTDRLIKIALHGLKGPVTVNGKVYQVPEVQPEMPGLHVNPNFTDEKIAAILTYVRNAWSNQASAIDPNTVGMIRKQTLDRKEAYTERELKGE